MTIGVREEETALAYALQESSLSLDTSRVYASLAALVAMSGMHFGMRHTHTPEELAFHSFLVSHGLIKEQLCLLGNVQRLSLSPVFLCDKNTSFDTHDV